MEWPFGREIWGLDHMPFKLHEPPAAGVKKNAGAQCFLAAFLLRFFAPF
jgi:hypothetical protein